MSLSTAVSVSGSVRLSAYDPHRFAAFEHEVAITARSLGLDPSSLSDRTSSPSAIQGDASSAGIVPAVAESGGEAVSAATRQREAKLHLAIVQAVPKHLNFLVRGSNTAAEAIDALRTYSYGNRADGLLALATEWKKCKLSSTKGIDKYDAKVRDLMHRHRSLHTGSPSLSMDLSLAVIGTIDVPHLTSLVSTIMGANDWQTWTPENIVLAVRRHHECHARMTGTQPTAAAMIAANPVRAPAGKQCHYCKKQKIKSWRSHRFEDCRRYKRDQAQKDKAKMSASPALLAHSVVQPIPSDPTSASTQCWSFVSAVSSPDGVNLSDTPSPPFERWIVDSGSSSHITGNPAGLLSAQPSDVIVEALGITHHAHSTGNLPMFLLNGDACMLHDTIYVPGVSYNLLSVPVLLRRGLLVSFQETGVVIHDKRGTTIATGTFGDDNLVGMYLRRRSPPMSSALASNVVSPLDVVHDVHQRLHHIHLGAMKQAVAQHRDQFTAAERKAVRNASAIHCEDCLRGKPRRHPISKNSTSVYSPLQVIVSDVCGPFNPSVDDYRYFVTFIDIATRVMFVFFLKQRNAKSLLHALQAAVNRFEKMSGYRYKVRGLRSDNAKEYRSHLVTNWCREHQISPEYANNYVHEQNGIAERANRTLQEGMHTSLEASGLRPRFWAHAVHDYAVVRNHLPSAALDGAIPLHRLCPHPPPALCFQPFGCRVIVQRPQELRRKGKPPTFDAIYLGQSLEHKDGYHVVTTSLDTFSVQRNIRFLSTSFPAHSARRRRRRQRFSVPADDDMASVVPVGEAVAPVVPADDAAPAAPAGVDAVLPPRAAAADAAVGVDALRLMPPRNPAALAPPHDAAVEEGSADEAPHALSSDDDDQHVSDSSLSDSRQEEDDDAIDNDSTSTSSDDDDAASDSSDDHAPPPRRSARHRQQSMVYDPTSASHVPRDYSIRQAYQETDSSSSDEAIDDDTDESSSSSSPVDVIAAVARGAIPLPPVPSNYRMAMASENAPEWQAAIDDEVTSLWDNETFVVTKLPKHAKAIPSRFVFAIKQNDGIIERYKARLVAGGHRQVEGVHYDKSTISSPTMRAESFRILLVLSLLWQCSRTQFDVKTAFLNPVLNETVYMRPPQGMAIPPGRVLRLRKSIYGLVQSSAAWYKLFSKVLHEIGYVALETDPCVYVKHDKAGDIVGACGIHVDDGLVLADSGVLEHLSLRFTLKIFGEPKHMLSLKLIISPSYIRISQRGYVDEILNRYGMASSSAVPSPTIKQRLIKYDTDDTTPKVDKKLYQGIVGALLYLARMSRPDIMLAVCQLSRHSSDPREPHYIAAKRVLRYIRGTGHLGLRFSITPAMRKGERIIQVFTDADWAGDTNGRKSVSGTLVCLDGNLISWRSKTQKCVALSSCESELYAAVEGVKEALWLNNFLDEIHVQVKLPIQLYMDAQSAEKVLSSKSFRDGTKHVQTKHYFVRDLVQEGKIIIIDIDTTNQVADILTKPTVGTEFTRNRDRVVESTE